jgi:hypothetical protein
MKHLVFFILFGLGLVNVKAQVQFEPPVNLSDEYGPSREQAMVNIGVNYYLVWNQWGDLMFRKSTNAGVSWGNKITLYSGIDYGANYPVIAAANGNVYAFYHRSTSAKGQIFMVKSTNDGQSFAGEVQVTQANSGAQIAQIAASGDTLVLAYEDRNSSSDYQIYVMTSINAGQTWSTAQSITNTTQGAHWCNIALKNNQIYALWNDQTGSNYSDLDLFFSKSDNFGQTWSTPQNLSNNKAYNARLKTKVAGNSIYTVVSSNIDGLQTDIMLYRSHNLGNTWEPAINLSNNTGGSERPDVWVDSSLPGNHRIYAVWSDGSFSEFDRAYLKYSVDHGQTWSEMLPFSQVTEDAAWPQIMGYPQVDTDQLYMTFYRPHDGTFNYEIWGVKAWNQLEESITFSGHVNDIFSNGIANARLTLNGTSYFADAEGFFEIQLLPGNHSLRIDAQGFISHSEQLVLNEDLSQDFELEALLFPPLNLAGEVSGQTVALSWDAPASEGSWMHWDDGENTDAVGGENIEMFDAAIRFTPEDLQPYNGQFLTLVSAFFASTDAEFFIRVWQGGNQNYAGNLVVEQIVDNPVANQWNNIELSNPVQIDASQELWIGYRVINANGAYPAGTDNGPAIPFKGDMILYGADWLSMSDYFGWDINWNIQGFVVNNGRETALSTPLINIQPENSGLPEKIRNYPEIPSSPRGFTHFNIYRNDMLLAEVAAVELDYTDALTLDENIYHVTSARGPFESVPSNPVNVSFVDVHKVASLQAHLEIFPNPVSEKINLQFNLRAPDELILEIFNTNGSCIYTNNYLCGAGSQTLNLNRADFSMSGPSGIILIRLTGQFHQFAAKVLLE